MREIFINKAILRHGDKYNYTKVNYINSITKVEIICKIHGSFFVRPDSHVRKVGCPSCNGGYKYTTEEFISKVKFIHGDKYDYSKVNYINSITKVEIICKIHGSFFMNPSNHINKQNCRLCVGNENKTTELFITDAIKLHGNKYNYSKVDYVNNRIKVEIICNTHKSFYQIPKDHLNGHGCNKCKFSKGENDIAALLSELNISYISQHKFENCRNILPLPFDFYLPDYNICIEYDGRQHFEIVEQFGGVENFIKTQENDVIKTNYCIYNDIKLVRVKYNDKNGINNLRYIWQNN